MIVISDIHGCYDSLIALLAQIPQEEKDRGIVVCGDLIDRGSQSRQVVQWAIDNKIMCIRGNHEDMMLGKNMERSFGSLLYTVFDAINDTVRKGQIPTDLQGFWMPQGGFETMCSYETFLEEILDYRGIPTKIFELDTLKEHIEWIKKLPYFLEFKDIKNDKGEHLLVTHGSAAKVWKWNEKRRKDNRKIFEESLTWNRNMNPKRLDGIFNVFGHTPQKKGPRIKDYFACIDTGCKYGNTQGLGKLTAFSFPSQQVWQQEYLLPKTKTIFEELDEV